MAWASAEVKVRLPGLTRMRADLTKDGPVRKRILTRWAFRYRVFAERRFIKFSRGGGDWPALTSKRRRGATSAAAILRNTGLLLGALSPKVKAPGSIAKHQGFSVMVGYGGAEAHADGGGATIADIARFHQTGAGHLPVRKVVVPPDRAFIRMMAQDAVIILEKG